MAPVVITDDRYMPPCSVYGTRLHWTTSKRTVHVKKATFETDAILSDVPGRVFEKQWSGVWPGRPKVARNRRKPGWFSERDLAIRAPLQLVFSLASLLLLALALGKRVLVLVSWNGILRSNGNKTCASRWRGCFCRFTRVRTASLEYARWSCSANFQCRPSTARVPRVVAGRHRSDSP